jgi:hypothetical protein
MLATFKGLTRMPSRAVSETAFRPSQVDGHAVRRRAPNLDEAIEELRQITESSTTALPRLPASLLGRGTHGRPTTSAIT